MFIKYFTPAASKKNTFSDFDNAFQKYIFTVPRHL